jgi:hypothetical protein
VAQSANAGNIVNRGITRSIFRWDENAIARQLLEVLDFGPPPGVE